MSPTSEPVVVLDGARTPIGRFNGTLSGLAATDLGGIAIAAALERSGVDAAEVEQVIMGHVLTAGEGQSAARSASVKGGVGMDVPAVTVNKVCLSGLQAINVGWMMIATGQAEVVVAGGMESMSSSPYLLPKARTGYGYGHGQVIDSLVHDGLTCAIESVLMGEGTDGYARTDGIAREAQDAYAVESHERAARAIKDGILASEIVPVSVAQRKGDPVTVADDEGVRPGTDPTALAGLAPAFVADGTVTAGNASQISDGGSAVVLASADAAERLGSTPVAELVAYGQVAGPDNCSLLRQPSTAIMAALDRASLSVGDVDLFEINEAFAAVALGSLDHLGITSEIANVNGGAIAVGHPLGVSGNRIALTAAHELRRRGGGIAAVGLCGGGGQGDALVMKVAG
ncbi:MAG: acetyl-CoA C-acyltransferase [Acidimicrobiia bacterium]|nr:acetyl-CoA C-acyltransferase [Acidimicrobiia bacterium]